MTAVTAPTAVKPGAARLNVTARPAPVAKAAPARPVAKVPASTAADDWEEF
jgi:hypothetical protein